MALPSNVTTGIVRGRLLDGSGRPMKGTKVVFTPTPTRLLNVTSVPKVTILPDPVAAIVDAAGDYEQELTSTDNEPLNPRFWTWNVRYVLPRGKVVDSFHIEVPAGSDRDMADITPVASANGVPLIRGAGVPEWAGQPDGRTLSIVGGQPAWGGGAATKRVVPLQVTGPYPTSGGSGTIAGGSGAQGSARYPVKLPASVSRFRVHVRNYSYANAAGFAGAVNLSGLWWGRARFNLNSEIDGGFQAAPAQVNGAAALPADGGEWVSGWITPPEAAESLDYLLSLGWTIPADGAASLVSNWTRHWRSGAAADAGAQAPALTAGGGTSAPFDIWLECEIPAATRVVAFVGDSITIGNMHDQSFPLRYALAHRVWPVVFAHYGGGLSDWGSGSLDRWTRYGSALPVVDATVLACGVNDVTSDATLNDLKNRTAATVARIRTYAGPRIFISTILPSAAAAMTTGREANRVSHNTWLGQFRVGITGTIDLAKAVANPADVSKPLAAYVWDGLHPTDIGALQLANAIPHLT